VARPLTAASPWWRGGAIYQVYPRSFADADGDGIGDLDGLNARLPYIASLGVEAVWLTPINPSGGVDGGYDVTDYLDVDPVFGGLPAFERFVSAAHEQGLRVIVDFVPNHTSDRHPWFVEARTGRDSPKRDWYVFVDGRGPDGQEPPNNWASMFSGSAWVRDERSGQWYLASFYPQQPDLNWANPEVRRAMHDVLRTWLDRGVDGFRIDVVHRLGKDPELRDNPPTPIGALASSRREPAWSTTAHLNDENGPEVHRYLREMREALGEECLLLGEVWLLDLGEVVRYLAPGELDLAFNFPFALSPWEPGPKTEVLALTERLFRDVWPAWHLSNHDMPRVASRYGASAVRAAAILVLTLRGTPVLYQGEEIGMADGEVPAARRFDPIGRDGCRTPMQWDASPNAGFCPPDVEPWLPVAEGYERRNVAAQEGDPVSELALYRRLLSARREHPALATGATRPLPAPDGVLAFERSDGHERFAVMVSLGDRDLAVEPGRGRIAIPSHPQREGERVEGTTTLRPDEAIVVHLDG
jgi:alpha-glucosidase